METGQQLQSIQVLLNKNCDVAKKVSAYEKCLIMTPALLPALAAYIPHDRVENLIHPDYPLVQEGVALIADISGFTPLTEALTQGLSPDQGAEELTAALNSVFTPLIDEIYTFRGSVIKFGGDALIVWYPREPWVRRATVIWRALTSAWRMQQAIKIHGQVPTPIGMITLTMKVGLTYGPVKRLNLGLPQYGYEDVLGGLTMDRMAEAEHLASSGEIVLDAATLANLPQVVTIAEWRDKFAVVGQLLRPARPRPWPLLNWLPIAEEALIERLIPYVPAEIYQTLAAGRAQVAELKPVVSLFVQFHGLDYEADPAIGTKLQTYFVTAQQIVARYGGRLNRLITGDKGSVIHVIFGAPRTVEEQEVRAIRCALDLQQECGGLPFITMQRIGVTVGRVFAGPVGAPYRHDYTVMGDSINLSSRLMQNAAGQQILIEAAVRAQLGDEFEVVDLGEIKVKGKAEPIPVFSVQGVLTPLAQSNDKQLRTAKRLFGRDHELTILHRRLKKLSKGQGGVITLIGEVGTGKTHLIDNLRTQIEAGVTWADGVSLAYGQTPPGFMFISVLRDLINLPPGHTPEETSQHLLNFCTDLFNSARVEATYPYLARFMGLPLSPDFAQRVTGLAGESLRWQIFEVIRDLLLLLLSRRPLVLALDDLQWADPTSLQLVEAILPLSFDHPLLLFLALRPERESRAWALCQQLLATLGEPEHMLHITLNHLDQTSAAALITHAAPGLPERLMTYLIEKSGGNPLFLVEIVRTLEAQGLLSGAVDLNQIALDALDLPNSIQGLLLAQIDRLTVAARHILQLAAVIGKVFFYKILAVLAAEESDLPKQLATLAEDEYILRDDPTDLGPTYTFRHLLIQESAYNTLLYEHRRVYHRQVAEALERLFPAYIAEQAGLLGFHYERAGDFDQAIYYHLQAADQARLLYANEEAESLYQAVLRLLDQQKAAGSEPDLSRQARTYLKIAQVRANALDFAGAQEFYNRGFNLLEQLEQARPLPPDISKDGAPVMRLGVFEHGPLELDPGLSEVVDESDIIPNLFEGLVELDAELNVIPALAQRWHVDEAGTHYQFTLRPNLTWNDGTPLTAHDFVFAWCRNLHPQTGAGLAYLLYVVQGAEEFHQGKNPDPNSIAIRALDDLNLEIILKIPAGYFPYLLARPITYPQPAHVIQTKGDSWAKPENLVCNGPFEIASWQQGQEISLVKNPHYRGFAAGNLAKASLYFVEPSLDHYMADQIDWCPVDDQPDLPARYPEEIFLAQYLTIYYLGFSYHFPPFKQRLVRQAFAQSVNQKELVKEAWGNVQRPALGGAIPPGMPGHSPEIGLRFDPEAARDRLKRAGYNSGADLPPLTLAALADLSIAPRYLQENWREHLGVHIQIVEDMTFDEIVAKIHQNRIQLALGGWEVDYPDPDNILRVLFHSASPANYLGWQNQQFDQLVERAAGLTDQTARLALYHQADRLLVLEETAIVPLYYWQGYGLMQPKFKIAGGGKILRGGSFKLKDIIAT